MKLSVKIIIGFILTNVIYLLLMIMIFLNLRPLSNAAADLDHLVIPLTATAADFKYRVAEQRSNIRAFTSSLKYDEAPYNNALAQNKAAGEDMERISIILSDPRAAFLKTPPITDTYQKLLDNFTLNRDLLLQTVTLEKAASNARADFRAACWKTIEAINKAVDADLEASKGEPTRRVYKLTVVRGAVFESWVNFVIGLTLADPGLFQLSQAKAAEADDLMSEVLADVKPKSTKLTTALENSKRVLADEYLAKLRTVLDTLKANAELSARRFKSAAEIIENAGIMNVEVQRKLDEFTRDVTASVIRVNVAMLFGLMASVVISALLAVFITRSIMVPINTVIDKLVASVQEVSAASEELTGSSNTLSQGVSENAASLEETGAALEKLGSMTNHNTNIAVEANTLMGQASANVTRAEDSMSKVIGAMEEISQSGNEIGKIIKTIDEIAFQINLLALNAAVEAARAGDVGAGFAVVADEVRNLAIRSADAARSTADLIASTINSINTGSEMVTVTAEVFKAVETNVNRVGSLVSEVAEASRYQSEGIGQITKAMGEMEKVTQGNAATAEESAGAAGHLAGQADNLMHVVDTINVMTHGADAHISQAKPAKKAKARRLPVQPEHQAPPPAQASPDDDDFEF